MKPNILIVDDKNEFRQLTALVLKKHFTVRGAQSGEEALSFLLEGYTPDLIVTDLVMPGLDGESLLRELKSKTPFRQIPVIVLSNMDKSSERVKLIRAGACDFMMKPYNPEELIVRIENHLRAETILIR